MRHRLLAAGLGLAVAMAIPAAAQSPSAGPPALRVNSFVPGLSFTLLSALPAAPAGAASRQGCESMLQKPAGAAGQQVAAAGWGVTGEAAIGRYQAVSFAGGFEGGTSGSCQVSQGNLAIFEGGRLLAVAYAPRGAARGIGTVEPLAPDGLRLWDGDFLPQPLADLKAGQNDVLAILPLAAQEAVCAGRATVPNIYGLPIDLARQRLRQQGWTPVPATRAGAEGREGALAKQGITEVEGCSGTGFGFCRFGYRGPAGLLGVTTVGDASPPVVSGYGVQCGGG
ncbi:hypothetical protein [Roseomonas sp. 18066]|uniref:hypothetical protein n=1 Tax=Roseomonas sp. 18066 TaxID=2681412 RepID=UPI0013597F22|nr:hypothetical protein [Roseomonas sp. 18066]